MLARKLFTAITIAIMPLACFCAPVSALAARNPAAASMRNKLPADAALFILLFVAALLLLAFAWAWSLRRKFAARTAELSAELASHIKTESALRESEERFRVLTDNAPVAIAITDADQNFVYLNSRFTEILGYTMRDIPDTQAWFQTVYPDENYREYVMGEWEKEMGSGVEVVKDRIFRVRCKNGRDKDFSFNVTFQSPGQTIVLLQDVSERIQAVKSLRESEERFRMLSNNAPVGIALINPDMTLDFVNRRFTDMTGYELEALTDAGKWFKEALHEIGGGPVEAPDSGENETKTIGSDLVFPLICKDGSRKSISLSAAFLHSGQTLVMFQDITGRMKTEEALRTSEQKYRTLVETTNTGLLICDEQGRVVDANEEYVRLSGRKTLGEILGRSFLEWTAPHDLERNAAELQKALDESSVFNLEVDYISPGGIITPIEVNARAIEIDSQIRIITLCRDITRRRQNQAARESSEKLFRSYFELSATGIAIVNTKMEFVQVNDEFCKITGYARKELGKIKWNEIAYTGNGAQESQFYGDSIMDGTDTISFEKKHIRPDGSEVFAAISAKLVRKPGGEPDYFIAVLQDISARKAAEENLRLSEERLAFAIEAAEEGLWDLNTSTMEMHLSPRFHEILGFSTGEIEQSRNGVVSLIHPEDWPSFRVKEMLSEGNNNPRAELLFRMKTKKGEWRWILGKGKTQQFNPDGSPLRVVGTIADVTERKRLQEETLRSTRLASIGELAAGVAHEINNPINGIINCAQLLADDSPKGSQSEKITGMIIDAGERIAAIVRNLLDFARPQSSDAEAVELASIIRDTMALFESQRRKDGITAHLDLPPDLPRIIARQRQIQQVFLNLISNARYALNQKYPGHNENKILRISATRIPAPGGGAQPFVRIVFRDAGCGMPQSIIDKITAPFFTTKPPDMGTGLGLSVSHGIVKDHGGRLLFDSAENEYTEVIVELPAECEPGKPGNII